MDGKIGAQFDQPGWGETATDIARGLTTGTASALADAATRTALGDGNFGDNIRAAIPNVIGQALGNVIANRIGSPAVRSSEADPVRSNHHLPNDASGHGDLFKPGALGDQLLEAMVERGATAEQITTAKANPDFQDYVFAWNNAELSARAQVLVHPLHNEGDPKGDTNAAARAEMEAGGLAGTTKEIAGHLINANDSFVRFAEKHPRIAELGLGATQTVLSGGFTMKAVKTIGGSLIDGEIERAVSFVGTQTTNLLGTHAGLEPQTAEVAGLGMNLAASMLLGQGIKEILPKSKDLVKSADDIVRMGMGGDLFKRPHGHRKGVRDKVFQGAVEPKTGRVRDPKTGHFMSSSKPWDMGHKPGHENWKAAQSARDAGLTREEWLDMHNDPDNYRPELPSSNRGRTREDRTETFLGDPSKYRRE